MTQNANGDISTLVRSETSVAIKSGRQHQSLAESLAGSGGRNYLWLKGKFKSHFGIFGNLGKERASEYLRKIQKLGAIVAVDEIITSNGGLEPVNIVGVVYQEPLRKRDGFYEVSLVVAGTTDYFQQCHMRTFSDEHIDEPSVERVDTAIYDFRVCRYGFEFTRRANLIRYLIEELIGGEDCKFKYTNFEGGGFGERYHGFEGTIAGSIDTVLRVRQRMQQRLADKYSEQQLCFCLGKS
jgi:hypothetical protein